MIGRLKIPPKILKTLLFSSIIFFFVSVGLIVSNLALTISDRIFYGVSVDGAALGGLTQEEAQARLRVHYARKLSARPLIEINGGDASWEIAPEEIDFEIPYGELAAAAYHIGREENVLERFYMRLKSAQRGVEIESRAVYQPEKLRARLLQIGTAVTRFATNAYCEIEDGDVAVREETIGRTLDIDTAAQALGAKIAGAALPCRYTLPIQETAPQIVATDLAEITKVLASYTTHFNAHNTNRSENIRISAGSINRLLVRPGETVSFNTLVGPRIAEAGFKEAPVIIEGKTVPDIGGGVCQVSSTLYNAILLADLKPIERTPHFHPLGYVPIGLDATVADNLLDFKFQNTLTTNVYIISQIAGGELTVFVLGSAADASAAEISVHSAVDQILPPALKTKYDSTLPRGKRIVAEEGLEGYLVSSYRVKTLHGQEVSRELLYQDQYTPEDRVVIIGTKAPLAKPAQKPQKLLPAKKETAQTR